MLTIIVHNHQIFCKLFRVYCYFFKIFLAVLFCSFVFSSFLSLILLTLFLESCVWHGLMFSLLDRMIEYLHFPFKFKKYVWGSCEYVLVHIRNILLIVYLLCLCCLLSFFFSLYELFAFYYTFKQIIWNKLLKKRFITSSS